MTVGEDEKRWERRVGPERALWAFEGVLPMASMIGELFLIQYRIGWLYFQLVSCLGLLLVPANDRQLFIAQTLT